MTGLLSLPTELLQDIGAEVATSPEVRTVELSPNRFIQSHHDPRNTLRLVCKQINLAWEPQVLSTIKLSPQRLSSQVESLATTEPKPTSASKYANCLEINGLYLRKDRGVLAEEEAKLRSFLFAAVASLTRVRTVIWDLHAVDPEWAVFLVLDALASLPLLQDLHLNCGTAPKPSWQPRQLPHIVNFSFTSAWEVDYDPSTIIPVARFIGWNQPKLKTLTIDKQRYYYRNSIQNLNDFLSGIPDSAPMNITHLDLSGLFVKLDATLIPHLRSLTSLHLKNILLIEDQGSEDPGSSAGNIWSSLRLENIHLQDIVTDHIQLSLIEYLTSFSGLRRLRLRRALRFSKTTPLPTDQLAIMFYERALQNHVRSLESLEIDAGYEGNWCFANHCASIIQKCARLTILRLSINSKDIGEEDDDDDVNEDQDGKEDGDDDNGDGDEENSPPGRGNRNAIWLLLDICANLPVFRAVELLSASRGDALGSTTTRRQAQMNRKIADRVKSYGPITSGHAFRVSVAREGFGLRCDELGMNVGYRRISVDESIAESLVCTLSV